MLKIEELTVIGAWIQPVLIGCNWVTVQVALYDQQIERVNSGIDGDKYEDRERMPEDNGTNSNVTCIRSNSLSLGREISTVRNIHLEK